MEQALKKTFVAAVHFKREGGEGATVRARGQDEKAYEYLLPEGALGTESHGVVFIGTEGVSATTSGLRLVTISKVKELGEAVFDGDLKTMVAVFDIAKYNDMANKRARKVALLGRIDKVLTEQSKVAQLRAATEGGSAEAQELLNALEKL